MGVLKKWGEYDDPRAAWDADRARPNTKVTVDYSCGNNQGLPQDGKEVVTLDEGGEVKKRDKIGSVTFTVGDCPCSICGHTEQWQCEDNDCECCSELCT